VPYDPNNPDEFRSRLKALKRGERCSSEQIIAVAYPPSKKVPPIAAATLNRFIAEKGNTTRIRKTHELRTIADALENHREWRQYFPIARRTISTSVGPATTPFDVFVSGVTQLFPDSGGEEPSFPLDGEKRLGDRLLGYYAMYRPSWVPYRNSRRYTDETMVSLVQISKSPFGVHGPPGVLESGMDHTIRPGHLGLPRCSIQIYLFYG
jgi:hypothetical protein